MSNPKSVREAGEGMTLPEAQNIAFRLINLKSDKITLEEIKHAFRSYEQENALSC
jgi:hypothetical protein